MIASPADYCCRRRRDPRGRVAFKWGGANSEHHINAHLSPYHLCNYASSPLQSRVQDAHILPITSTNPAYRRLQFRCWVLAQPLTGHYESSTFCVNYNDRNWHMNWNADLVAKAFSASYSGQGWSMKTFAFPGIAASNAPRTIETSLSASLLVRDTKNSLSKRHEYWGLGLSAPLSKQIDEKCMCTFTIVGSDSWVGYELYVFSLPVVLKELLSANWFIYIMYPDMIQPVGVYFGENG